MPTFYCLQQCHSDFGTGEILNNAKPMVDELQKLLDLVEEKLECLP